MMKTKLGVKGLIVLLSLCLAVAVPRPARAINAADTAAFAAWTTFGVTTFLAFSYLAWYNRPGNQDKVDWSPRGPGGFYFGAYMGASFAHSDDWNFDNLVFPAGGTGSITFSTIKFDPGVVGGLKLGYFFHSLPWFGVEVESSFNRQDIRQGSGTFNRAVGGSNQAEIDAARLYVWTMAFHFMGRYGFLKDKEVPFGRLQPYVGLGPGFVIVYSWRDAAKNFSLDAEAGVRYMLLRNLSAFVEYKFSQQWEVELEDQRLRSLGLGQEGGGTAKFDFTNHKIVVGVTYHFL